MNTCHKCNADWPVKFRLCPVCGIPIPPVTLPPAQAAEPLRAVSAYRAGRAMLHLWLILSLLGGVVVFVFPFVSGSPRVAECIAVGVAVVMNGIILHALGQAMFDRADCALASQDQRTLDS